MLRPALLLLALGVGQVFAQGVIAVTGRIPCSGQLQVVDPGNAMPLVSSGTLIRLSVIPGQTDPRPIVLSVRTNCAYRITAEWSGPPATALGIVPARAEPAAGIAHLARGALDAVMSAAELAPDAVAVCVQGVRVSSGGNNVTPDNAILVRLLPSVQAAGSGIVSFQLNLGG